MILGPQQQHADTPFAEFLGCDTGGNSVAGAVREFRQKVSGRLLEEANIRCGPRDVIESGGRGYRLSEKITVCHQDGPQNDPKTDPQSEPNDPNTGAPDVCDDDQLNDRQRWALAQLKAGKQLRGHHPPPVPVPRLRPSADRQRVPLMSLLTFGSLPAGEPQWCARWSCIIASSARWP